MPGPHSGKRTSLTLAIKKEIIERNEKGQRNSKISSELKLSESTVRTVLKNKVKIKECLKAYGASAVDSRRQALDQRVVMMERYLSLWISRKETEGVPLDKRQIRDQAKLFYQTICGRSGIPPGKFSASTGWLYRFLGRKEIRNIKLTGEVASADEVAAKEYPAILKRVIEEGGYDPELIYNMDEAGMQYKKMPKTTFLAKQIKRARGRKADKTRITMVLCCNLTGTHKVKPLIIHTAKHPRCYKHLSSMSDANVYWRSNVSAWMTSTIAQDWVLHCLVPETRGHARAKGLPHKVLILMDNCSAHPDYLTDLHPDVQVLFLPPNTTSVVQPLDQEIIAIVKFLFQKRVYEMLRDKTESNAEVALIHQEMDAELADRDVNDEEILPAEVEEPNDPDDPPQELRTVHSFWRQFTVKDAVDNLVLAWDEINAATIHRAWNVLCPHLVKEVREAQVQNNIIRETLDTARQVPGFNDVTRDELVELNAMGDTQTAEDVMNAAEIEENLAATAAVPRPTSPHTDDMSTTMRDICAILAIADQFKDTLVAHKKDRVVRSEMMQNF